MTLSKAEIWSDLKARGYTADMLKAATGNTYAKVSKIELSRIYGDFVGNKTEDQPQAEIDLDSDMDAMFASLLDDDLESSEDIPVVVKKEQHRSANSHTVPKVTGVVEDTSKRQPYIKPVVDDTDERARLEREKLAYLHSQVWENGQLVDKKNWHSKGVIAWLKECLPLFGGYYDPTKAFTLYIHFMPEKEWRLYGEQWKKIAIKSESRAAMLNRKKTAFYQSAHSPAPKWSKATLRNLEKVESEYIVDSFLYKEPLERALWQDPHIPAYSGLKPNPNVLFLEYQQDGSESIKYILPKKEKVHTKQERLTVKRSDLKLNGMSQTVGKDRLVWHPVLNKAELLNTRFRFNQTKDKSASISQAVYIDYRTGDKDIMNDGWKQLIKLGTIEVIPHCERYGYVADTERYNILCEIANKYLKDNFKVDDSALSHYLNNHDKVKKFYKGWRFTVHNGIISKVGTGLQPVATLKLIKTQNLVKIVASKECYNKDGKHFPEYLDTIKDAQRWLQHNFNLLIEGDVKVTQNNKVNHKVNSDIRFMSKQLIRQGFKNADHVALDETTAQSIAARLQSVLTPKAVSMTAKRLGVKANKVSELFNPKGLGLWDEKAVKPTSRYYEIIELLCDKVAEIKVTH